MLGEAFALALLPERILFAIGARWCAWCFAPGCGAWCCGACAADLLLSADRPRLRAAGGRFAAVLAGLTAGSFPPSEKGARGKSSFLLFFLCLRSPRFFGGFLRLSRPRMGLRPWDYCSSRVETLSSVIHRGDLWLFCIVS